ncbi:MAG: AlkZ family DNA glycosylase [Polyangiaceae bacterium]|jgi:uncharacterized protein YcaQ|nr:AlkZ family DNA glycosylase [Polyangiaceae bacterium]
MVSHLGLARFEPGPAADRVCLVLERLRCIQLDPLDVIGQNADLVVIARVRGAARGQVHRDVYPGRAFEHFAKERCLLPARAFPHYRGRAIETPWWRHSERMKKLDRALIDDVLCEVRERGPLSARQLTPRGAVKPLDWSGWKGTSSAAKLALEVLWTRCDVVVAGRAGRDKLYDVPERALPAVLGARPTVDFDRWALLERVHAAGMLPRNAGPHWSMLSEVRTGPLPELLVAEGVLEEVQVAGSKRTYLTSSGLFEAPVRAPDDALRILGPLDPLLWDRSLVRDAFGFDYVWEVYKPASERRWGWYVCPLYHQGELVGRVEAAVRGTTLAVDRLWPEAGKRLDKDALGAALSRHAEACGCDEVTLPKRARAAAERRQDRATARSPRRPRRPS